MAPWRGLTYPVCILISTILMEMPYLLWKCRFCQKKLKELNFFNFNASFAKNDGEMTPALTSAG